MNWSMKDIQYIFFLFFFRPLYSTWIIKTEKYYFSIFFWKKKRFIAIKLPVDQKMFFLFDPWNLNIGDFRIKKFIFISYFFSWNHKNVFLKEYYEETPLAEKHIGLILSVFIICYSIYYSFLINLCKSW